MTPHEYFALWAILRVLYDTGGPDPHWVLQVMRGLLRTRVEGLGRKEGKTAHEAHLEDARAFPIGHAARLYMLHAIQGPTYLVQEWVEYTRGAVLVGHKSESPIWSGR